MKRIVAAVKQQLEATKAERKVKRIFRAIDIAKDNALEAQEKAMDKKLSVLEEVNDLEAEEFIEKLSDCIQEEIDAVETVDRLDKIKTFLEEEVKTEG